MFSRRSFSVRSKKAKPLQNKSKSCRKFLLPNDVRKDFSNNLSRVHLNPPKQSKSPQKLWKVSKLLRKHKLIFLFSYYPHLAAAEIIKPISPITRAKKTRSKITDKNPRFKLFFSKTSFGRKETKIAVKASGKINKKMCSLVSIIMECAQGASPF